MPKILKKFTERAKRKAVARLIAGEKATNVGQDLHVTPTTLYQWKKKYNDVTSAEPDVPLRRTALPMNTKLAPPLMSDAYYIGLSEGHRLGYREGFGDGYGYRDKHYVEQEAKQQSGD